MISKLNLIFLSSLSISYAQLEQSRLIFEAPEQQLKKMNQNFTINNEELDPFGLTQENIKDLLDSQKAPVKQHTNTPTINNQTETTISLAEVVSAFPINGVIPYSGKIMTGTEY